MASSYQRIPEEPGFFKDTSSGVIYFIKSVEGRKIKFSCRTDVLKTAKTYANRRLKQRLAQKDPSVIPLMGYWVEVYVKQRQNDRDLSESAIRNSVNGVKRAAEYWSSKRVDSVTKEEFHSFYEWFKLEYPDYQFENTFKYFRNFLNWLKDERYRGRPVPVHIPNLKNPEAKEVRRMRKAKKERTFTPKEIERILYHCETRDELLILLMYTMGFRIQSDALNAKWSRFKIDAKEPFYQFGEFDNKAGLEGRQAISTPVLEILRDWRDNCKIKSEYIFPQSTNLKKPLNAQSLSSVWSRLKKESGVDWSWTPHTFRHSCLTRLAEENYPMHLICKCYRISAQEFMATYAHLTTSGLQQMRDAIRV